MSSLVFPNDNHNLVVKYEKDTDAICLGYDIAVRNAQQIIQPAKANQINQVWFFRVTSFMARFIFDNDTVNSLMRNPDTIFHYQITPIENQNG